MSERALTIREPAALPAELSVNDVLLQVQKIQDLMSSAMKDGEHYGVIPGTGERKDAQGKPLPAKKTLLKPGAEKLCLMFQFAPEYKHEITQDPFTVISTCTLYHRPSGSIVATGSGMCSAAESKYAWRKAERACPKCEKPAIIKDQYKGGWLCWPNAKNGPGCGAHFDAGDAAIEKQETGRIANPDVADQFNTVLKMADKRALVAAVLNGTAASDIFTQDLEDIEENLRTRQPKPEAEDSTTDPSLLTKMADKAAQAAVIGAVATELARPAPKKKKEAATVETTATTVSEGPQGEVAKPEDAVTTKPETPAGVADTAIVTKQYAAWLANEIAVTNANYRGLMASFAGKKEQTTELSWGEAKKIASLLEKRRALKN